MKGVKVRRVFYLLSFLFVLIMTSQSVFAWCTCCNELLKDNDHTSLEFSYLSDSAKKFLWLERLCNVQTSEHSCHTACSICEWSDVSFPGEYTGSEIPGNINAAGYKCHAVFTGVSCGLMVNQQECESNQINGDGCAWNASLNQCVTIGWGANFVSEGSSCALEFINPTTYPDVVTGFECGTPPTPPIPEVPSYTVPYYTHMGHDVYCINSVDYSAQWFRDFDSQGTWYMDFNNITRDGGYFEQYPDMNDYDSFSCVKGPDEQAYPRASGDFNPSADNCTCISDIGGPDLVDPRICLSSDYRIGYNCPDGYHLPERVCYADTNGDNVLEEFTFNLAYNQTCNDVCSTLRTYPTSVDTYNCDMFNDQNYCEIDTQNYGLCGTSNPNKVSVCSPLNRAQCDANNYCNWVYLGERCVKGSTNFLEGSTCGDGVIGPGEECEGSNLNGQTCASLGMTGTISCDSSCHFTGCVGCNVFDTSHKYFEIKNQSNAVLARIDQSGRLWIKGIKNPTWVAPTGTNNFIVQDSAGTPKMWIQGSTGNLYIAGGLTEYAPLSSNPGTSGNLIITDRFDVTKAWITSTGDVKLRNCFGQNKNFSCIGVSCYQQQQQQNQN